MRNSHLLSYEEELVQSMFINCDLMFWWNIYRNSLGNENDMVYCSSRMEWPLDRVNPATLDVNKKKNRSFYGVIIGESPAFWEKMLFL